MAAITASQFNTDTPVSEAYELFSINMNDVTSVVITPTNIKAINSVQLTPTNSTAATAATSTYVAYTYGGGTVTITSAIDSTFVLKICGNVY